MSANRVIGKGNTLPWNIPEELKWFKEKTLDQVVLMGRKTYESIGRPLPRRESIVLSRNMEPTKGLHVVSDLAKLPTLDLDPSKEVWVIGGAEVYKLLMPYCSDLFLTHIKLDIEEGDAYFPDFEAYFNEHAVISDTDQYKIVHYVNTDPISLA